jgi:hypothetical protein
MQTQTEFTALLVSPSGDRDEYTVTAKNKTEAKKRIAEIYRRNTPGWRNGFYSFSAHKFIWMRGE